MDFDWDPAKARTNLAKHGVSLGAATVVFDDPFAIERLDDTGDYGEERFVIVGRVQDLLLSVAFVARGPITRLISARRATRKEQDDYFRQGI